MNKNHQFRLVAAVWMAGALTALAQGSAFTYQGRLASGTNAANGTYDLRFTIYDSSGGPTVIAGPLTNSPTSVSNGLFTVTLDFGAGVFTGADRWLEIGVRTNGGGAFTGLTPRQKLTPTPYAIYAPNAGAAASATTVATDGVVTASLQNNAVTSAKVLDGTITAADVNAASFSNTFWKVDGNLGTTPGVNFLGTTDNQPLELKANRLRALRLEPTGDSASDGDAVPDGAPNVIAGSPSNYVFAGVVGATISGGGATNFSGSASPNIVAADYAAIGGGMYNIIQPNAAHANIDGGRNNTVYPNAIQSTIGGGSDNKIYSGRSTIGGGFVNSISAEYASIGGGSYHQIQLAATHSTIGGGFNNEILADSASATISGGYYQTIHTNSDNATIAGGQNNQIFPNSGNSIIGGGYGNTIGTNSPDVTIGGGVQNTIETFGYASTIGGGVGNSIQSYAYVATIGGGEYNSVGASADHAMIVGGYSNRVGGSYSLAAGRQAQALYPGTFVWADSQAADFASTGYDQFLVRAAGGVGINTNNPSGASLNVAGEIRAGFFAGSGSGLSGLNASQLTSGVVPASALSGTYSSALTLNNAGNNFSGNGSGLTSLNAGQLTAGTVPAAALGNAWQLGGNAGTTPGTHFMGTTDNQPVEFKVNNDRALRLEPGVSAPNLVGGYYLNSVDASLSGAVVAGGVDNHISGIGDYAVVAGGNENVVSNAYAVVVGGYNNAALAAGAFVGGGGNGGVVPGRPRNNIASGVSSVVVGGSGNSAEGGQSFIGGGTLNITSGAQAAIVGGYSNSATADYTFAAGRRAKANHPGALVWADSQNADFNSTGANQFLIRSAGGVGINTNNPSGAALNAAGEVRASSFTGSGSGLSGLNASGLASGTVADARLSTNVALRNATQTFTGNNAFLGTVGIGTTNPATALTVATGLGYGIEHTDGTRRLSTYLDAGGCWLGTVSADPLHLFVNNGGYSLTIDLSSRVGIGRAPTANKLEVEGNASKTAAGSWLANSDARIKQDIQPVSSALEKIARVRLVSFRYTDDYREQHPSVEDRRYLNVVAQQFREIFPEHVKSSGEKLPDGSEILQVDTYPLTIYSAAAVQELNRKLEQKETEITELQQRLEKLERLMNEKNGGAK